MNLQAAIASLEKARVDYQQQQYQHNLALLQHQADQQRQQYQAASLLVQQQEIETKLKEVASVPRLTLAKYVALKCWGKKIEISRLKF